MRKFLIALAALALCAPLAAQTGPKYGKNGGIGSSTSTYSSGEPTGGTYAINGTTGVVSTPIIHVRPAAAPVSPSNGDCWSTTAGFYCRINGVTVGPSAGLANANTWSAPQTIDMATVVPSTVIAPSGFQMNLTRSGGAGSYGYNLTVPFVAVPVGVGEFDVAVSGWTSTAHFSGGYNYGGWFGANTPSSDKPGETFTIGASIGAEFNAGNRWADFGLQYDIGGDQYTAGIQVVPDVVPAPDVAQINFFPGTFAVVIAESQHTSPWWTGILTSIDGINPGGFARATRGGSTAPKAPAALEHADGYWTNGVDLSSALISGYAFKSVGFGVDGGGALYGKVVTLTPVLFSDLAACDSGHAGTVAYITDASAAITTWHQVVSAGGGSNKAFISCNGTTWNAYSY